MIPQRCSKSIDDYPSKFDWPGIKGIDPRAKDLIELFYAQGSEDWGARWSAGRPSDHMHLTIHLWVGAKRFLTFSHTHLCTWYPNCMKRTFYKRFYAYCCANKCTLVRYAIKLRRCASSCACGRASIALWKARKSWDSFLLSGACRSRLWRAVIKKLLKWAFYHWQRLFWRGTKG